MLSTTRRLGTAAALFALAPSLWAQPDFGVDLEAVRAHADFLADDRLAGRNTGEAGYDVAALYAATRFRQFGLEPGHGDAYEQPVPLLSGRLESAALAVHRPAGSEPLVEREDFLAAASVVEDRVARRAPVVFAGWGIAAPELGLDDYARIDVAGKIALVLTGAPERFPSARRAHHSARSTKEALAAAHGAVGILYLRTRVDERRTPWPVAVRYAREPAMRWRHPDGRLEGDHPPLAVGALLSAAGAAKLLAGTGFELEALLDRAETGEVAPRELGLEVSIELESRRGEIVSPNVVARLPGADPQLAHEHVVVTAHLDHLGVAPASTAPDPIHNGYFDNALGCAIVLELARALAAGPERPRRSILFVLVTAEERGLLGSDYFAHYPGVPGATLVANVNLDMPLLLAPLGDLVAFGAEHSTLGTDAAAAARAHGLELSPDPAPEQVVFVRSDQYSFVRRGVPALFLVPGMATGGGGDAQARAMADFLSNHYHRPSDEATLGVDWESVRRYTAVHLTLLRRIADAPAAPRWHPGDFFGVTFGAERAP